MVTLVDHDQPEVGGLSGLVDKLSQTHPAQLNFFPTAANAEQRADAANRLSAFINLCDAQRGKSLTDAQADILIADAQAIIDCLLQQ